MGIDSEEDSCVPMSMKVDVDEVYFVNVKCEGDATVLLSDKGTIYACGGNR